MWDTTDTGAFGYEQRGLPGTKSALNIVHRGEERVKLPSQKTRERRKGTLLGPTAAEPSTPF